jgi:N-acetyl-anhydromuramyl-L-alanine amidase AmpD
MNIVNLIADLEWHATRRWSTRELNRVNKIIVHQELGEGTIENVNRYHVQPNHISPKGCPHFCYHYGIRKSGEIVQVNELSHVTWHTKGQNSVSIGIMLVGNFAGPGHDVGTTKPTDEQMISLEQLVEYLKEAFKLTNPDVFGHYHFGKPACPGYIVQEWIENYRNKLGDIPQTVNVEKTVKEIQKRLNTLGYSSGKVDGVIGVKTLAAIRKFQADNQLIIDGIVGPQTWKRLLVLSSK